MSHYAQIDQNNIVLRVIVAEQEFINSGVVGDPKTWIQTSYNARIRGKFAGIGDIYDPVKDEFTSPIIDIPQEEIDNGTDI